MIADQLTVSTDCFQFYELFFAQWCGHCKNLKPHWKSAAEEFKFGAVDATVHQELAHEYGVRGIV